VKPHGFIWFSGAGARAIRIFQGIVRSEWGKNSSHFSQRARLPRKQPRRNEEHEDFFCFFFVFFVSSWLFSFFSDTCGDGLSVAVTRIDERLIRLSPNEAPPSKTQEEGLYEQYYYAISGANHVAGHDGLSGG